MILAAAIAVALFAGGASCYWASSKHDAKPLRSYLMSAAGLFAMGLGVMWTGLYVSGQLSPSLEDKGFQMFAAAGMLWAITVVALALPSIGTAVDISRARVGWSTDDFVDCFRGENIPRIFLVRFYENMADIIGWGKNFPLHPSDSLRDTFGIGQALGPGLDEAVDDLIISCGCRQPTDEEVAKAGRLENIGDLVRFLSQLYSA